jgi:Ca-activated chloride channel family protein
MQHLRRFPALIVALFLCWTTQTHAAGLLIADGGFGGTLTIKEHAARVTINNGVAVTEVTQVFVNMEDRQVEALYTFPVPKGASVANFSMWIAGKEMTGEVIEKKRAREIYNSYKQVNRDPGLLEQVDFRTFEMRIFPIPARAEQKVQVTYYQELDFDHDWATYTYPLATQTRKQIDSKTTGKFALTLDVKSEIPITELKSTSHPKDFAIAKHGEAYQQASLETRQGDLSRDVVLAYHVSRPRTGVDLVTSRTDGEDGYFMFTLTAGDELGDAVKKEMDYVFVVDISGSMDDDGKLDASRQSLKAFIDMLGEGDRFEVIAFNNQPRPLFKQLSKADAAAKSQAAVFLTSQEARGGTNLSPAVSAAYQHADTARPLNVVILSDGLAEQGERTTLSRLIKQRPAGSRVFAIGVGNDVNRGLLESLADDSGGLAAFLSRGDDFGRAAKAFHRKLQRPVATDLAIAFNGIKTYDVEPAKLPNLYHGQPVRIYGRYKGDGQGDFALTGKVLGHDLKQGGKLTFAKTDENNPEIERMWAWKRVDQLLKQADADGSRTSVIDEIVRLGEGYSIATEYTSFIVLENDGEFKRWKIDRKNALRVDRDRLAQDRTRKQLEKLRESTAMDIGPADAIANPAKQLALNTPTPTTSTPAAQPASTPPRNNGRNVDFNIGGGGAVDPITAIGVAGLLAAAWVSRQGRGNT